MFSFILRYRIIENADEGIRGAFRIFLSLIVFCGLMHNLDKIHLGIVNYTFYLSKDKIPYRYMYDNLFAHRKSLHKHTLIHCRFNMSRKQDKSSGNSGVYVDSTLSGCSSKYHIGRSFL